MRILHVASDIIDGAGLGSFELHRQLLSLGLQSFFFAAVNSSPPETLAFTRREKIYAKLLPRIERTLARIHKATKTRSLFSISPQWLHADLSSVIERIAPDVIHLHWVAKGIISPAYAREISLRQPVIWTLRDMNPLTGGCHYPGECDRWREHCGRCPAIASNRDNDISRRQHQQRLQSLIGADITILATSDRMREIGLLSPFRELIYRRSIPASINLQNFIRRDKLASRQVLGLEADKQYVLFSALKFKKDPRKSWWFVEELLRSLGDERKWCLLLVGDNSDDLKQIPNCVSFGRIHDSLLMSAIYSAADVTLFPSEEEAFGKVGAESLSCGTPVIVADGVGMSELVEPGKTGLIFSLSNLKSANDAIAYFLGLDAQQRETISLDCAASATNLFGVSVARAHLEMYEEITRARRQSSADHPLR